MITVEKEVLVERPADEVFDFLADVRNEERWNPNVLRTESEADGPLAVGGTSRVSIVAAAACASSSWKRSDQAGWSSSRPARPRASG
jgi:Polyketide cyclase / dehydrase and lipid transport